MSENSTRLKYLIGQYSNNAANATEEKELFTLIEETSNEQFESVLTEMLEDQHPDINPERTQTLLTKTLNHLNSEPIVRKLYPWKRWVAAAAVLVVILSVTYFLTSRNKDEQIAKTKHVFYTGKK